MTNMPPSTQADANSDNPSVKLRMSGDVQGARTYVGNVTGTRYRFGGDPSHMERLVYQQDVQALLDTGNFERVQDAPPPPPASQNPLGADTAPPDTITTAPATTTPPPTT